MQRFVATQGQCVARYELYMQYLCAYAIRIIHPRQTSDIRNRSWQGETLFPSHAQKDPSSDTLF